MGAVIATDRDDTAVVDGDGGDSLTYRQLAERVPERIAELDPPRHGLTFLRAASTLETVVDYLALRQAGAAVVLLDPTLAADVMDRMAAQYRPELVLGPGNLLDGYERVDDGGHAVDRRRAKCASPIDWIEPVSVLLPTSGSTGSPKLVQLSDENLNVNALDISDALAIDEGDRGLAPLPLFYSYGLSILNSHLAVGAATVLTTSSPLRPEFWNVVRTNAATSIPGVPYSYEMFRRVGMLGMDLPTVRYLTQAGGKLAAEQILEFHDGLAEQGRRFHIMYGQTEASPRMSTLPSHDLPDHADSVGPALAHGRFEISEPDQTGIGEVLYEGPNVMLGYADDRADLGVRSQFGALSTGDLGLLDECGRLVITGRIKRIAKLFGTRVSLQDIESQISGRRLVAAVEGKNRITVFVEGEPDDLVAAAKTMERRLQVPPRTIRVVGIDQLPRNANGKVDYRSLSDEQ